MDEHRRRAGSARGLRHRLFRLGGHPARGRPAHRRPHPDGLDHRPHHALGAGRPAERGGAPEPDAADAPLGLPRRAGRRAGGQLFPGKRFRPGGKSPRHDAAGVFRHRQPADGDRPARRGGRAPSPQPRGPLRRPGRAVRRLRPRPPRRAALEADAPSAQEQPPGAGRTLCPADGPVDLLRRPHRRFRHGLRLPHHGGPDGPWGQHHRRRHLPAHLHRQHRGRPHRQKDLYPPLRRPAAHGGHRILVGDGLRRGQLPHR